MPPLRCTVHRPCLLALLLVLPLAAQAQLGQRDAPSLSSRPEPLPIEQAFPFFVSIDSPEQLSVTWTPAAEHYLYRHQFAFALASTAQDSPTPLQFSLPEGIKKQDEFFGDIEAYYGSVSARLPLAIASSDADYLLISFQGCADWGFCYPPQTVKYALHP